MKEALRVLFIVCIVGFFCGCATIFSGKTQKINVTTEGGKDQVALIDGQQYKVPAVIDLKRENKDKFIALESCPKEKVLLQKGIETTFWINILSAGVFGSTTDYASDSMWKYEPVNISLKCSSK